MTHPFVPSYAQLAKCFKGIHKNLAFALGYSGVSSVDKMCEKPPSDDNPDGCGSRNFLDTFQLALNTLREVGREEEIHELCRWTSHIGGGFYTPYFEPSGIHDNDFCRIINGILASTNNSIEELRLDYFDEGAPRAFSKEERLRIYRQLDDLMGRALQTRAFVDSHKADK